MTSLPGRAGLLAVVLVGCAALWPGQLRGGGPYQATPGPVETPAPMPSNTPGPVETPAPMPSNTPGPVETPAPMPSNTPGPVERPSATATAPPARPVLLPYLARGADLARARPRTWGLQFALEDLPRLAGPAYQDLYDAQVALELPRGRHAGLRSIRTNLRWDWIEPRNTTPEDFDWSLYDERLKDYAGGGYDVLVALVGYPAWATRYQCGYALLPGMDVEWRQFVRAVARRYGAERFRVVAWEIGNEVDGKTVVAAADHERSADWGGGQPTTPYGGCWGDRPADYKEFLRAAYEEIKAVDRDAEVTLGGLANADIYDMFHMDFLEKLLAAGGGAYFDVLNYHWFPDVPDQVSGPEKHRRLVETLARHGLEKPTWLTETYRLSYPTDPRGELAQVRFLTQELIEVLADPRIERVYWYGWVDFPPAMKADPRHADRGVVRADHTAKPAVQVLPTVVEFTNGRPADISTARVRAYRYTWPRDRTRLIAWSADGAAAPLVLPAAPGSRAVATFFQPDMLLAGRGSGRAVVPEQGGSIRLDVGADTIFVELVAP